MAMKRLIIITTVAVFLYGCCQAGGTVFSIRGNVATWPVADSVSVLRNPCCGWGLYDDAEDEVADAEEYWERQDEASDYASFFYIRWR